MTYPDAVNVIKTIPLEEFTFRQFVSVRRIRDEMYNFTQNWTHPAGRYNTIQYNTIQYNTIQYNTIQYNQIYFNFHTCQ